MEPLIFTIIIPVYNSMEILNDTVNSIINQTYENFELILVDDGSTDGSDKLCDSYSDLDKRIITIHKKNEGQAVAINLGLDIAKGDYLTCIGHDDLLHPDYLKNMHEIITKYNADVVSCQFEKIYNRMIPDVENKNIIKVFQNKDILHEYLNPKYDYEIYHNLWNKVYKKTLFKNIRIRKGVIYEDLDIQYQLLSKANTLVVTSDIFFFYYKGNPNSITKNYKLSYAQCTIQICDNILSTFKGTEFYPDSLIFVSNQYINGYELLIKHKDLEGANKVIDIYRKRINSLIVTKIMPMNYKFKFIGRRYFPKIRKIYKQIKNTKHS